MRTGHRRLGRSWFGEPGWARRLRSAAAAGAAARRAFACAYACLWFCFTAVGRPGGIAAACLCDGREGGTKVVVAAAVVVVAVVVAVVVVAKSATGESGYSACSSNR
jgi:hypothetical protein